MPSLSSVAWSTAQRLHNLAFSDGLPRGNTSRDVDATYHANPKLSIFGHAKNLLDTDCEEVSGYDTAGLSAQVGLNWSN